MRLLFFSRGLEERQFLNKFLDLLPTYSKACCYLITTAAMHYKEANKHYQALYKRLLDANVHVTFMDVEKENPSPLETADAIILGGGNPYYLLHHLRASGTDKIIHAKYLEDTLIVGISAGGLVLQANLHLIDYCTPEMNTIGLEDKTALGLIEEFILPHYDRFLADGTIKEEDIKAFEKQCQQQVLKLNEAAGIYYKNGLVSWIK